MVSVSSRVDAESYQIADVSRREAQVLVERDEAGAAGRISPIPPFWAKAPFRLGR